MPRSVVVLVAGVALVNGCAAEEVGEPPPARPGALRLAQASDEGLVGAPIAVGSRSGAADLVLGAVATEVLEAAGADVTEDLGLGDPRATREAQLAGLVDLTWERTGTAWLTLLRQAGASAEPAQLHEDVADADLDENGIVWLDPAPADTGVAVVASSTAAEAQEVASLTDLAVAMGDDERPGVVICTARPDAPLGPDGGLVAFAEAADLRLRPRQVVAVPRDQLVPLTEDGTFCPFAILDLLDPALADADLTVLPDDLGAFVAQNPAVTVREDTAALAPGLDEAFAPVAAALDTETLRALAAQVSQEGRSPDEVARDWLVEEGLAERR